MTSTSARPLRVLIVEDQFLHRTKLKKLVKAGRGEVIGTCRDLAEFRELWPRIEVDLVIVDLHLGQKLDNRDGWMVATEINTSNKPRPVIICSKHNGKELWRTVPRMNYVVPMGKDVSLNQYLMTAYPLIHKFYPDADRMFLFHPGGNSPRQINDDPQSYFFVKNDALGYAQKIDPNLITMAKSEPGSKIRIYYENQQIVFSQSLNGLQKIAQNERLARVSDSVVVNYDYVHGKSPNSVHVKTWGEIKEVSIGKAYAKNVEEWWRYFRSK